MNLGFAFELREKPIETCLETIDVVGPPHIINSAIFGSPFGDVFWKLLILFDDMQICSMLSFFGSPLFSDVFWKLLMLFDDMQIFPSRFEEENNFNNFTITVLNTTNQLQTKYNTQKTKNAIELNNIEPCGMLF